MEQATKELIHDLQQQKQAAQQQLLALYVYGPKVFRLVRWVNGKATYR